MIHRLLCVVTALFCVLFGANSAGETPYRYTRFYPAVLFPDGMDTTTVEVATDGTGIREAQLLWQWGEPDWRVLYDDGTHGDRLGGDGIHTLAGLSITIAFDDFLGLYGSHHVMVGVRIKIIRNTGEEFEATESIGLADPGFRPPSVDLGQGCSATRSAFFIADSAGEIFPGYPVTPIDCGSTVFPAAYKKLYENFPDAFDFLVVMPANRLYEPDTYEERVPYCVMVSNQAEHIGLPVFDRTAEYFSAGRLKSVIFHSFGSGAILDHEIGHTWGMRTGFATGIVLGSAEADALYGHWLAETDIDGMMNYFISGHTLENNGDGTWRLKPQNPNFRPYSPIELYTIGLIPPEEVPPIHILHNLDTTDPEHVTADSVTTVTVDEIIALEGGERNPPFPRAQTDFHIGFIFVSDRALSPGERAYHTSLAEYFASDMQGTYYLTPFETASGNRAILDASMPGLETLGVQGRASAAAGPVPVVLSQNYPNPFNPATAIPFEIRTPGKVRLTVFDRLGRKIAELIHAELPPGMHTVTFDSGALTSGVYFYRIQAGMFSEMRKMIVLR
jgi:hypothetical protein